MNRFDMKRWRIQGSAPGVPVTGLSSPGCFPPYTHGDAIAVSQGKH